MKNKSQLNQKIETVTLRTLVVGIDIAKEQQWARFVDCRGVECGKALFFSNDRDGFERILSKIRQIIKENSFEDAIVGMEPTGHYWKSLANFLKKQKHIHVVLVNPYHTKKAKELDDNSQTKSDKKDALTIARLVKDGRYSEVYLPHDIYADLRVLSTARDSVNRQKTALENRILAIIYNCVGLPMYALRFNMVSVTSRNVLERNNVTTIRSSVTVMIAGVVVSLGIVGTLYPMILQKDLSGTSWFITVGMTAIIAFIFSFVEYFWTRERVTEENQKVLVDQGGSATVQAPLLQQIKNVFTNKYFLLALMVTFGFTFYDNLQGGNARVNMITYILGGNDQNGLQLIYLMASMQPMAIGAVVVPILSRKFSARKIMMISSVITVIGIGIALTNPSNFVTAVAGGFVFAAGIFAVAELKELCAKKGLDFDSENQKYLDKQAAKAAKYEAKMAKRAKK